MTGNSLPTLAVAPPTHGNLPRNGQPRTWPYFRVALLLGLLLHVAGLGLFRITADPPKPLQFPHVYVTYANTPDHAADTTLSDQADLFDTEPLFLPTRLNFASRSGLVQAVRPPTIVWPAASVVDVPQPKQNDFLPEDEGSSRNFKPIAALQPGRWAFLGVFGQDSAHGPKLAARGAFLRVVRLDPGVSTAGSTPAGPVVLEEAWPAAKAPKSTQDLKALWGPASFLLLFTNTGVVGQPLLVDSAGPGLDSVDDELRALLDERFRQHPLPPGTYEATISP
jgi:hypothetical protein